MRLLELFGNVVEGLDLEDRQINHLANDLSITVNENGGPVNLAVGKKIVEAAYVLKVEGYPKADVAVYNIKDEPVAYISLKGPKFSWGSWLKLPLPKDVKNWINNVRDAAGEHTFQERDAVGYKVKNTSLVKQIMYGLDFGKENGVNNVDCVLIGQPASVKIVPEGKMFKVTAQTVYANGDMPSSEHAPYLCLRFSDDRDSFGVENARAQAYPMNDAKTRFLYSLL